MCTTQSSLTPVQTLWHVKRTLKMSAMGKVLTENSWNFLCLSIMWFSFRLVTFKQQISDDVKEIIIKRPRLNFDQNCHFHKNETSKVNGTFRNGFLSNKTIKMTCLYQDKILGKCQKVKNVNFNTLEWSSWIVQFLGRGTLDFELFPFFSSKMGSGGITSPIPVITLIWNYALKMTLYSPPLLEWAVIRFPILQTFCWHVLHLTLKALCVFSTPKMQQCTTLLLKENEF